LFARIKKIFFYVHLDIMMKAAGVALTTIGAILLLAAWKVERQDIFIFNMIFGPLFIYLGTKMLI